MVFAEPAARDFEEIIDYIVLDSPSAAEAVFRAIVAATKQPGDFPRIGHPGRLPATRELSVVSLPYVIVYEVDVETVTILAVFHGAHDLARALRERRGL